MQGQKTVLPKEISNYEELKIFTDRDIYISGDILFFSIKYLITINDNQINPSKIVYVELINLNNESQPVQQKYKLKSGTANGQIILNDHLPSGVYVLRAYTQFQRNFPNQDFARCFLTILNPKQKVSPVFISPNSIQIAPESNILIGDLKNNIVIEIPKKYATKNTFYLSDDQNNRIKKLELVNDNLILIDTVFSFNKLYSLHSVNKIGLVEFSIPLPKVQDQGIQTNTTIENGEVSYSIYNRIKNSENLNYKISVFSNQFQNLMDKNFVLDDSLKQLSFQPDIFKKGINYIVLFNNSDSVIKVNSVFIPKFKLNRIQIEFEKDTIGTREKAEVAFNILKDNGIEFPSLSASVMMNESRIENRDFSSSFLFQDSQILETYLYKMLFTDPDQIKRILTLYDKFIDKKAFNTPNLNTDTICIKHLPDNSEIKITGSLIDKKTGIPLKNQRVFLSVVSNSPKLHIHTTDENGEFIFPLNNMNGSSTLFLCSDIENTDYKILVNNPFEPSPNKNKSFYYVVDVEQKDFYRDLYINSQIMRKFIRSDEDLISDTIPEKEFNIKDEDRVIFLDNYVNFTGIEELLIELVPNVSIRKNDGKYSFVIFDDNGSPIPGKPIVLLDYIPIFDINQILKLDISKIKSIEVINKPYILGSHILQGVIILNSKTDNFTGIEFPNSAELIKFQGIETNTINLSDGNSELPDFRTTLFWDPSIKLKTEKKSFEFKTSDRKGIFNILIEGVDIYGNAYFGSKQFVVD
jgi:hypothetical protein